MDLYNYLFNFVVITSKLLNIDESHAVKHSMDVFFFSNKIYNAELEANPNIKNHKDIIDTASILHDMCDKKYMNEAEGVKRIFDYMKNKLSDKDLDITLQIISTMSYSTIKKNGFPLLGEHQLAYHIVREADLLASYDFDRCIMYQMLKNNVPYRQSYNDALEIFDKRVFKYIDDDLFYTDYSKRLANKLHISALKRISILKKILK